MYDFIVKLAGLFAVGIVLLFVRETYIEYTYRQQAAKHGCQLPRTKLDRPFGIPAFIRIVRAQKEFRVLQFTRDVLERANVYTLRAQNLFSMNIITVEPENIKTVLATSFKDYSLGMRYDQFYPLLGDGIFTLSGAGWKHSRAMLRPQFSRDQVSQLETLDEHVNILINTFKHKSLSAPEFPDGTFDAQNMFHRLTLDTATEFLFGKSVNSLQNDDRGVTGSDLTVSPAEFADAFNTSLRYLSLRANAGHFYFLITNSEFRKAVRTCKSFVDFFVQQVLAETQEEKSSGDFQYVFLKELAKETRDPVVLRDQAFNILLAGRDTTASLLSYTIFHLARNKPLWHKLREAVLADFGDTSENLTFETLKRCTYLNNVINEALRLTPVVPLNFRQAINDTVLPRGGGADGQGPIFVPKGARVMYSVYYMQRRKDLWGEDADEFRPERWTEGKIHNWDFLPFNGGPRICLGQQFALTEASFTLVRVLQSFKDVDLATDQYTTTDVKHWLKLTTSVHSGVRVKFTPA